MKRKTRRPRNAGAHAVSARDVCVAHLAEAKAAADGLNLTTMAGLHRFRVALRRLRVLLDVFRRGGGDVRRREIRALSQMEKATNQLRDRQVQQQWLQAYAKREGDRQTRDLLKPKATGPRRVHEKRLRREFAATHGAIMKQLAASPDVDLQEAARTSLQGNAAKLARWILVVDSPEQWKEPHRARIAGRKIRYVLEAMAPTPASVRAMRSLRRFQDLLGELRDAQLLDAMVRRRTRPSALGNMARARRDLAFRRVERALLGVHAASLIRWVVAAIPPPKEHPPSVTRRRGKGATADRSRRGRTGPSTAP